jgi:DNA-binding transcriptional MerR regulator
MFLRKKDLIDRRALDLRVDSKVYPDVMSMTVSKLAERAGLTPDAVRYYEKIGLLPPPERTESGYRLFGHASLSRLEFIKSAQRLGLRLGDIKQLLEVMDNGLCPCGHTEDLLRLRMAEVDEEIRRLTSLRASMAHTLEACPADCSDPACWPCGSKEIAEWSKGVNNDGCC